MFTMNQSIIEKQKQITSALTTLNTVCIDMGGCIFPSQGQRYNPVPCWDGNMSMGMGREYVLGTVIYPCDGNTFLGREYVLGVGIWP